MAESDVQRAILDWLAWHGILAWRTNSGAHIFEDSSGRRRMFRGAPAGTADIIGILPGGRFLAIECKTAQGRLRPAQKEFIDQVNELGGLAFVARNIEDVEERIYPPGRP